MTEKKRERVRKYDETAKGNGIAATLGTIHKCQCRVKLVCRVIAAYQSNLFAKYLMKIKKKKNSNIFIRTSIILYTACEINHKTTKLYYEFFIRIFFCYAKYYRGTCYRSPPPFSRTELNSYHGSIFDVIKPVKGSIRNEAVMRKPCL